MRITGHGVDHKANEDAVEAVHRLRESRADPSRRWAFVLLMVAAAFCAFDGPAWCDEGAAANETAAGGKQKSRAFSLWPDADFYPQYIADPLRPQNGLLLVHAVGSDIPETGDRRFLLRLGGRFPIFRWHRPETPDRGWQFDFEGGFFGLFDMDNSLDSIGWDGLFGFILNYRAGGPFAFRIGKLHDSAHIGDEYAERTGRERIGATREEYIAGVSWSDAPWRLYGEAGYGTGRADFQEPWRAQVGVEYIRPAIHWSGRMGWYAALDATFFEERDWQANIDVQVGMYLPTGRGGHRYRLAIELYHGRSVLGEFSLLDETWIAVGWYFDF